MITSAEIKEYALNIGFDGCGICRATDVGDEQRGYFNRWINNSFHAGMDYMERNRDKRFNPELLVESTRSIICVALNYYPHRRQNENHPQFAYYAYGKDYHDVVKSKLNNLLDYIKSADCGVEGRAFVDTAPLLERYWAAKSGLGFIGKNSLLIIPKKGSYYFLGFLFVNIEL